MDVLILALLLGGVAFFFQRRDEHRRIALLGSHLGQYQIEKLMETLTEGYMRALGEADPARQQQIWNMLSTTEATLCEQFKLFANEFARLDAGQTRSSKLPWSIYYSGRLFPGSTYDFRAALNIHARGICLAVNRGSDVHVKDKAFTVLAELFLMQHSCHWFCKTKAVASTRLVMQHQTAYTKVVESVMPTTRQAYTALVAR
jgi:hypothetical protein